MTEVAFEEYSAVTRTGIELAAGEIGSVVVMPAHSLVIVMENRGTGNWLDPDAAGMEPRRQERYRELAIGALEAPARREDVGADHAAGAMKARPLAGRVPARVNHVEPAPADPRDQIVVVVVDVEVPDFGGRICRDPSRDGFEASRTRQAVPFGYHEPRGAGAGRARIPKFGIIRARHGEQLVAGTEQRPHVLLLRGIGAVECYHHAVAIPRQRLALRPCPHPVGGSPAHVDDGIDNRKLDI